MNRLIKILTTFCLVVKIIYGQFDCHCPAAHPFLPDEMNQTYCGKELKGADCSSEGVYFCKKGQNVATPQQPFTARENCTSDKIYCAPPRKSECTGDDSATCLAFSRYCVDSTQKSDDRMLEYYGQTGLKELYMFTRELDPVEVVPVDETQPPMEESQAPMDESQVPEDNMDMTGGENNFDSFNE